MAKGKNTIGSWAFLIGVVLALLFGFMPSLDNYIWILVVIGLVVGLLNVTSSETMPFLMSGAVLIIAGRFGSDVLQNVSFLPNILSALLTIFVPATIIVAIKNVFSLARN